MHALHLVSRHLGTRHQFASLVEAASLFLKMIYGNRLGSQPYDLQLNTENLYTLTNATHICTVGLVIKSDSMPVNYD